MDIPIHYVTVKELIMITNIKYKVGNILDTEHKYIIHGCNCFHNMGAGVAAALAKKWPEVAEVDKMFSGPKGDDKKLGDFTHTFVSNGKIVFNAYTQWDTGTDIRRLNYEALVKSLEKICEYILWLNHFNLITEKIVISVPKIGCGLAGGNWSIVSAILDAVGKQYNIIFEVYVLDEKEIQFE